MTSNKSCIATFTLTPTTPPSSGGGSHSSGGGSYIKQPTLNTTSTTPTPTPAPLIITRTLKLKDIGDDVTTLQTYLKKEGYIINSIDGIFGNETKQAVISFQKANILTYDGIVGPKTREVITKISNNNIPVSSTVPVTNTNDTSFIFSKSLKLGSDHNDITEVNQLQKYLNTHGYIIKYSGFNSPGNETYYYGVSVKTALIKFQKANSLTPDGIFGSKTREVMNRGR
jgi:peptidoglycan hydrolase-like protein with peptidoglycan-binding domain